MNVIRNGSRVRWKEGELGGFVFNIVDHTAHVLFDDGTEQRFDLDANALESTPFEVGHRVINPDGLTGVVIEKVPSQSYPTLKVAFADNTTRSVPERTLRPAILEDPVERFHANQLGTVDQFNLRSVAADLRTRHLHDSLVSLSHARVDLKPHQVSVVHTVVSSYPHRFLLCDEVGLGKTIEAAMIIKELRARGLAKRVLVLVPSGLVRQWQFELKTKFNEVFSIFNKATLEFLQSQGKRNPWAEYDSVITSHTWASWTAARREEICAVDWDLVIVDEAHHARRQRTGNRVNMTNLFRLVSELTARPEFARRGVLFLTATPLQLQRHELFSLVEMLNPILFASESDFVQHVQGLSGLNRLVEDLKRDGATPDLIKQTAAFLDEEAIQSQTVDVDQLAAKLREQHRLSEVLIRNRRAVLGGFQPRKAFRWEVEITEDEKAVQDAMDAIIAEGYREAERTRRNALGFLMVIWQKLAASSSRALLKSLRRRRQRLEEGTEMATLSNEDAEDELSNDVEASNVAARITSVLDGEISRINYVIELLNRVNIDSKAATFIQKLSELFNQNPNSKIIVFTEFRETQDMLVELCTQQGWSSHHFHGQLDPIQKDDAIDSFRKGIGPQILVSTEAGGEGRNFQFAHILVNYDLPWNPMRVEQRIGRVDRIGQQHPVIVFNFHVQGTIEGRILDVLERRIDLFEESIGGLDPILGEAEADIRAALRATAQKRDEELDRVGRRLEERVRQARTAETQLQDFILDTKSYAAEIAQTVLQQKQSVSQDEFQRLMIELLRSVNTWVDVEPNQNYGNIHFQLPFTAERRDLIEGQEKRQVAFDPRVFLDSERVEYFGFGHPIIDALVTRTVEERHDGASAIRRITQGSIEGLRPGWQFVWLGKVGGLNPREFVRSTFVDDFGQPDSNIGAELLRRSRKLDPEISNHKLDTSTLDTAYLSAQKEIGEFMGELTDRISEETRSRFEEERDRIQRLYDNRDRAARDRIQSCSETLERFRASDQQSERQVIPIWEANLERARQELQILGEDRSRVLQDLRAAQTPMAEHRLLAAARIEISSSLDATNTELDE